MNDFIDSAEPYIEMNFKCQKDMQKDLIKFILRFSNISLDELSEVIEESLLRLNQVLKGQNYLSEKSIINLMEVFHIFAHSCSMEH